MPVSEQTIRPKPVVLVVLDGWGVAPPGPGNAITRAKTPNFDSFTQNYFCTTIQAAGEAVGLKWGEVGNSEVGHLNIGAGKVIFQPQPRIDRSIIDGEFYQNKELLGAVNFAREKSGGLHLIGMVSDTGVHSTIEHLYALLELAKGQGVSQVYIHAILDGRDAPYSSGLKYIERLQAKINEIGVGQIASISGRFWAMDRDNRWQRIEKAYRAIVEGRAGQVFTDPASAIRDSYQNNVFDEQFEPAVAINNKQQPVGPINEGDAVVFFNFRADRARQLLKTVLDKSFVEFKSQKFNDINVITFTEYDASLPTSVAFPAPKVAHPLAEVMSTAGLTQLHMAESEKYAHVTYFINGGQEKPFPGEERILVPSPPVTSYEEQPEMSALDIREKAVQAIESKGFDFLTINFANADMVGHTGNLQAAIRAIEVLDLSLGTLAKAVLSKDGVLCVTADHGNAESMLDTNTGEINKEHTSLPVPFILIGASFKKESPYPEPPDLSQILSGGLLSDIAPTILKIMKLPMPEEMAGRSLI